MRWGTIPHSARRHTQVPPYKHQRTAHVVHRAGPMCPAAGMLRKPPYGPKCSDCVGRGLAPAAGTHSPQCGGEPSRILHGGTRRCRSTNTNGLPMRFVGRDLCVPPPVCTAEMFRLCRAGACPRRRYAFAAMWWGPIPYSARRHTQVPPYKHQRTTYVVRRAGPMCPAAGTHQNH